MIASLERRRARAFDRRSAPGPWLPTVSALGFLGAGAFVLSLGAFPVALMLGAFGASVGAMELHARLRPRPAYAL